LNYTKAIMSRPSSQSLYSYDSRTSSWRERLTMNPEHIPSIPFDFAVLTWNVDFMAPRPVIRIQALIDHIEQLISPPVDSSPPPTIILLQELHRSCFPPLLSHAFVRAKYDITDISPSSWPSGSLYGTVTLVPKFLGAYVSSVFRTPFSNSGMGRDALYIDLDLPSKVPESGSNIIPPKKKLRVANTHLESLRGHGDRARPVQLGSIAKFLASSDIRSGLVAGDMNAISPSDINLPERVGLLDPWEEVRGEGDELGVRGHKWDARGHTWGYQPRSVFPPNRLDKILLKGDLRVTEMMRIGIGLKVAGLGGWVSDHYGLLASVSVQAN